MCRDDIRRKAFHRQRREQQIARQQRQYQSCRAVASNPAVFQNGENLTLRCATTKSIRTIGKAILMQATSDQYEVNEYHQGNQRMIQMGHQKLLQQHGTRADGKSHKWKELDSARE